MFSATLVYAQDNPIPGIEEGDLPEIRLDEQTIEKLRETAQWALDIVKKEMKAQRLADSYGPNGWRTVKGILEKNCFSRRLIKFVQNMSCLCWPREKRTQKLCVRQRRVQ